MPSQMITTASMEPTFQNKNKVNAQIMKYNAKVIAKTDQNTTGTRNVRCSRFFLIFLKCGDLNVGNTPDLYFNKVKITFGRKRAV